jgi:predicted RNase H-like HicB family nuclease
MSEASITIELELEDDGRWIAEIRGVPHTGILTYGETRLDAVRRALELLDEVRSHDGSGDQNG